MKDRGSVDVADDRSMSSKLKSSAVSSDSSTIEPSFQDGGSSASLNSGAADSQPFGRRIDSSQMENYPPTDANMTSDSYGKVGDNMVNSQPMQSYNGGGFPSRPSNNAGFDQQQHGGGNMANTNSEYPPQNAQYGHYGPANVRPGYGGNPGMQRPQAMPRGPGMGGGMVPPNYPPNQQRFMSGASIQQQGGPTPTLNQLLQNTSAGPRYQGNYPSDFAGMSSQKDMPSSSGPSQHGYQQGWNGPPQRPSMHPYQHPMQQGNFRGQGPMFDPRGSRPMMGPNGPGYSQQHSGPTGPGPGGQSGFNPANSTASSSSAPTSGVNSHQFSPNSSRFMGPQQPGRPGAVPPHHFNHQMPYGGQSSSAMSNYGPPPSSSAYSHSNNTSSTPSSSQSHPSPSAQAPHQPSPSSTPSNESMTNGPAQPQPSPQQNSQETSSSTGGPADDTASDSGSTSGPPAPHPAASSSSSSHPQQRPVPSPAGSNSSRCNTPGSVTGNQGGVGSPMPPRPPPASGQLDGQNRIQSPMANQGYPPHMMPPPPMGPGGSGPMGPYPGQQPPSNKMMSMMNMQQQQQQHYNSQYPGNFIRGGPPGSMAYGGRPGSPYAGQSSGPMAPMYGHPSNHSMGNMHMQGMPYPSHYSQQQYGYNNGPPSSMASSSSGAQSPASTQNNSTSPGPGSSNAPPSTQASRSPGCDSGEPPSPSSNKGAKAAAQAAMMAAANQTSSGKISSSGSPPTTSTGPMPSPQQGQHGHQPPAHGMQAGGRMGPGPPPYMNHLTSSMPPHHPQHQAPYSMNPTAHGPMEPSHRFPGGPYANRPSAAMQNMSGGGLIASTPVPNHLAQNSSLNAMNSMAASMNSGGTSMAASSPAPHSAASASSNSHDRAAGDLSTSSPSSPCSSSSDANDAKMADSVSTVSSHSGDTSVTQSINLPLTNPTENKPPFSPSGPQHHAPPKGMQPHMGGQENGPLSVDSSKGKTMDNIKEGPSSKPPTPASQIAPSPAASTHNDEFENISSPSWPGTPKAGGQNDAFSKLCEMGDEPDRRQFLERLFGFMEEKGAPITIVPTISKQPVDLYRLYFTVKEKGGLVEVTKSKKWRDVSGALNIGASSSAGFTLRKNYTKYIFPFECRFDLGNVDPHPILASLETPSKKGDKRQAQNQDPYGRPMGPQGPYYDQQGRQVGPQQGGPLMPPNVNMMGNANMPYEGNGMMPGNMMNQMPPQQNMMMHNQSQMAPNMMPPPRPGMAPNRETVAVQDPFSDVPAMTQQYPRPMGPMQQQQFNPNMSQHQPMSQPGQPQMNNQYNYQQPPTSAYPGAMGNQFRPDGYQQQPGPPQQQPQQQQGSMPPNQEGANRSMPPTSQMDNFSGQVPINRVPNQFSQQPNENKFEQNNGNQGPQHPQADQRPPSQCSSTGSLETQAATPSQMQGKPPNRQPSQPQPASSPAPASQQSSNNRQTPTPNSSNSRSGTPLDSAATPAPSSTPTPQQGSGDAPQQQQRPSSAFSQNSQSPMPQQNESSTPTTTSANTFGPPGPGGQTSAPSGYPQGGNFPQQQPPMGGHMQQYPGNMGPYPGQKPGMYPQQQQQQKMYPGNDYRGNFPMQNQGYGPNAPPPPPNSSYTGMMSNNNGPYPPSYNMSSSRPMDSFNPQQGSQQQPPQPTQQQQPAQQQQQQPPWPNSPAGPRYPMSSQPGVTSSYSNSPNMTSQANGPSNPYSPMHPGRNARMPSRMDPKGYPAVSTAASPMAKMPQPRQPGPVYNQRKDLVFPPDSVEAAQPHYGKKQRLTHKHLKEKVDPWRLMMSLRSGLLAESTWALDVLTILLYDDSTVMWFGLQNLPGLLDILLEHYRQCLVHIFGPDFEDITDTYDAEDPEPVDLEITDEMKAQEAAALKQLIEIHERDCRELEMEDEQEQKRQQTLAQTENRLLQMKDVKVKIEKLDDEVVSKAQSGSEKTDDTGDDSDEEASKDSVKKEPLKPCKLFDGERRRSIKPEKKAPRYRSPDSSLLKDSRNFTYRSRSGKPVKIEIGSKDHLVAMHDKSWNTQEVDDFTDNGIGCQSSHINIHFEHSNSLSFSRRQFFKNACKSPAKDLDVSVVSCCSENAADSTPVPCDEALPTQHSSSPPPPPSLPAPPPCDSSDCAVSSPPAKLKETSLMPTAKESVEIPTAEQVISSLKRKKSMEEDEAYQLDPGPLTMRQESDMEVSRRCLCLSNILRSLSFIPTNGGELSRHQGLMQVLGRLLLLHHRHPKRHHKAPPSSRIRIDDDQIIINGDPEEAPAAQEDSAPFDYGQKKWWWETLAILREDMLVTLANISGHLNLNSFPDTICLPVLDGLLHWAICPAACARDPLPTCGPNSVLSPHRLVLESMCKLCVTEANVDLLLATPPFGRMVSLLNTLVKLLADRAEQVMREFAIVLLSSLVQGDSSVPRIIAMDQSCIPLLLDFIEGAEQQAMQIVNSHGVMMLQDNPEMMGTSLDMLRRAAVILEHLAQVPDNRSQLLPFQQRLLHLVMSQFLDQHVASILSTVLFFCSKAESDGQSAPAPSLTSGLALC